MRQLQAVRGRALPFAEIQRYLLQDTAVGDFEGGYTLRTFQRDKHEITDLLGLAIWHRRGQGYYLADAEPLPAEHARLLEAVELQDFLQLPPALAPCVQPETRRPLGLEHLRPLLRAAQARQVVAFQYQNYGEGTTNTRTVRPLLLKEFRGRWYVLGTMTWSGSLACFGLDRIRELRATGQAFEPPAGFDAATYYAQAFGITCPHGGPGPQEIVLRFAPTQGRYALGYPLHASQHLLQHSDTEIRLALTVFDTHCLRMDLLSCGPTVEVLAPERVARMAARAARRGGGAACAGVVCPCERSEAIAPERLLNRCDCFAALARTNSFLRKSEKVKVPTVCTAGTFTLTSTIS